MAGFIAAFRIESIECPFLSDCRFLVGHPDSLETTKNKAIGPSPNPPRNMLLPPSLLVYDIRKQAIPIYWNRFAKSSNIWIDFSTVKNQTVFVYMDTSNPTEFLDMLQILSILYRKDPKKVIVVLPFIEQSTQDRVEFKPPVESIASVDTISKLIGQHTVLTFDLHSEQTCHAFHDLRCFSIIEELWADYHRVYPTAIPVFPDKGSAARFGNMPNVTDPVVFDKKRNEHARIVTTDDVIRPNQTYVVMDDMVRSGGTMMEVAKYLKSKGASHVDCLFTHAPLEPAAAVNLSVFRHIWTSDTCPHQVPREWVRIHVCDFLNRHVEF